MQTAPGGELKASVADMIEALGGPVEVAALFDLKNYRVPSMWRSRDRIPPIYRPEMKRLLEERGFAVPDDFLLPPARA